MQRLRHHHEEERHHEGGDSEVALSRLRRIYNTHHRYQGQDAQPIPQVAPLERFSQRPESEPLHLLEEDLLDMGDLADRPAYLRDT